MTASIDISIAGEADAAAWDDFVAACPEASFFHKFGWSRVIERAYGYRSANLAARRGGRIVAALPLVDVRSPLLGRSLISTAFTVGGGVAGADTEARRRLAEAAVALGRERRANYVELRGSEPAFEGWATKEGVYAGFAKEIPADEDANLKMIPRKRRAVLRKAIEAAERGALGARRTKDIDVFYPLYARALRDLGTPVFPRRFIAAALEEFAADTDILLVEREGRALVGLVTFRFRDTVMPYYIGAAPQARECGAFDYAFWSVMRHGAQTGARVFDFGRSKYGTGAFDYKTYWGFEPQPLRYQYALIRARSTPNVSPVNPKFAAFAAAWRRLPLGLANLAGPVLARHLA